MVIDFSKVTKIEIPEGIVKNITVDNKVIWEKVDGRSLLYTLNNPSNIDFMVRPEIIPDTRVPFGEYEFSYFPKSVNYFVNDKLKSFDTPQFTHLLESVDTKFELTLVNNNNFNMIGAYVDTMTFDYIPLVVDDQLTSFGQISKVKINNSLVLPEGKVVDTPSDRISLLEIELKLSDTLDPYQYTNFDIMYNNMLWYNGQGYGPDYNVYTDPEHNQIWDGYSFTPGQTFYIDIDPHALERVYDINMFRVLLSNRQGTPTLTIQTDRQYEPWMYR